MSVRGLLTFAVILNRNKALGTIAGLATILKAGQAAAEGKIRIAQQFTIPRAISPSLRKIPSLMPRNCLS